MIKPDGYCKNPACGGLITGRASRSLYCSERCREESWKLGISARSHEKSIDLARHGKTFEQICKKRKRDGLPVFKGKPKVLHLCNNKDCFKAFEGDGYKGFCSEACAKAEQKRRYTPAPLMDEIKRLASIEGSVPPQRRCKDCGTPTPDYRCPECRAKWCIKNKVNISPGSDSPESYRCHI